MKRKNTVSVIGVLIVTVGMMVLVASCGNVPSKYIGSYAGTWSMGSAPMGQPGTGSMSMYPAPISPAPMGQTGRWEGSVDKDGNFAIDVTIEGMKVRFDAKLTKDGKFSGSKTITMGMELKIELSGTITGSKVDGTISENGFEMGKFTGKKK